MNNPMEMVKEELCSKYGLKPEQIRFQLDIDNVDPALAQTILNDYANVKPFYGEKSGHTVAKGWFNWVNCFYPKKEEEFIIEAPKGWDKVEV